MCLAELAMVLSGKHLQLNSYSVRKNTAHCLLFLKKPICASPKYQPMDADFIEQKDRKKKKEQSRLAPNFLPSKEELLKGRLQS